MRLSACRLCFVVMLAATGAAAQDHGPWNLKALRQAPKAEWGEVADGVRPVYYPGEPYRGQPTRVFAYVALPAKREGKVPGMVLVHGGGGKAFPEWARLWAERGYAAVAMDLAGCGPDGKRLPDGGPDQGHPEKFEAITQGLREAWPYHAVAAVIRAHSLLRSIPEVDTERTGLTGISWGGYLTCMVAGLDDRFKVAIPVYGCGFIQEEHPWTPAVDKIPLSHRQTWIENYDPARYLRQAAMPMLFVNGTNDFAYPLSIYQKSYRLVRGPRTLCITLRLPHSHPDGWAPREIGLFADTILKGGPALPSIGALRCKGREVQAVVSSTVPLSRSELLYTTDSGPWPQRLWHVEPARLEGGLVLAKVPTEARATCFLNIIDERGATASSEHQVLEAAQTRPARLEPGEAQLFVDDVLIAAEEGLKRTLHQPTKDEGGRKAILDVAGQFEDLPSTLEANGTIVHDRKLKRWVMFALGYSSQWSGTRRRWDAVRIYRFTSADGLNWQHGDDGRPQRCFPLSEADLKDPASGQSASNIDLFSCRHDADDQAHPYKGWLYFANWGHDREGVYFMRSADGITWQRGSLVVNAYSGGDDPSFREIRQDGRIMRGPSDVTIFSPEPYQGRYLGVFKFMSAAPVESNNVLRSRAYAWVDRLDQPFDTKRLERIALLPAAAKVAGDEPHDEYYGSTAWRYGSMWLGGLKIWHGGGDWPWSAAGCAYLKLAASRDGLHWAKVPFANQAGQPEVFLPNGPEGGEGGRNDGGYMTEFSQGPLPIGDELVLYYGSSSWGKNQPAEKRVSGGGIFRARLRVDGFVSVDAGELTTVPLIPQAPQLQVNSVGLLSIEVLGAGGQVLGQADVAGDSIRHPVAFDGKSFGDLAAGGPVHLRFRIGSGGQLYSFSVVR